MAWEDCDGCDAGEYEVDGDDGYIEYLICPACTGRGRWYVCLSDYGEEPTWCDSHPREGREGTPSSKVEFFRIHEPGCGSGLVTEMVGASGPAEVTAIALAPTGLGSTTDDTPTAEGAKSSGSGPVTPPSQPARSTVPSVAVTPPDGQAATR
jgi:hypothetical protein